MRRRTSIYRRTPFYLAAIAFIGVFFGLATNNTPETIATVKATDFQAGRIIDDEVFYNADTMTVAEIQTHLDKYSASCDMWGTQAIGYGRKINGVAVNPNISRREYARMMREAGRTDYHDAPYVCVSKFYENPNTHKTNFETNGEIEEGMISASQIIYDAAHKYNINPQVLLVMLKKESYVWGDTWPLKNEYNTVMGYACPDTAPCNAKYFGFYNQVMMAAWQLNYYKEHIYSYGYYPYMTNNIYYSPDYSCGKKAVYLENIATTSLYIYTPYTPNDAALANYPGTAYCGSYGNRNFFMYFNEWFGSTYAQKYDNVSKIIEDYYVSIGGENSILGKAKGDIVCGSAGGKKRCYKEYEVGYIYGNEKEAWDISGGILAFWKELGGPSGYLGYPISSEERNLSNGGTMQSFDNGKIVWLNGDGFTVAGGIYNKWEELKAEHGELGLPLTSELIDNNGLVYQQFQGGRIYWDTQKGAWVIPSHYIERWMELGGNKGIFDYPISLEKCGLIDDGCFLEFKTGYLYWHPEYGTWDISGGIYAKWKELNKEKGELGYPKSGEQRDEKGLLFQQFEKGRIYWNVKKGASVILDHYINRWNKIGALRDIFGVAIGAEVCNLVSGGCYQNFEVGALYWHPEYGTWDISGGIYAKWKEVGKESGILGYPTSGEQKDEKGNLHQNFEHGNIYWDIATGAWVIRDFATKKWVDLGGFSSKLKKALSTGYCGLVNNGCYQAFETGNIYWTEKTGAWDISGGIYDAWFKQGTEWGPLGYPTSSEIVDENGKIYQTFENGIIYWDTAKGATIKLNN